MSVTALPREVTRRSIPLYDRPISVTMTGDEWTSLLAYLLASQNGLSAFGKSHLRTARMKLAAALEAEC